VQPGPLGMTACQRGGHSQCNPSHYKKIPRNVLALLKKYRIRITPGIANIFIPEFLGLYKPYSIVGTKVEELGSGGLISGWQKHSGV